MILGIAVFVSKLLYNYIKFSVPSARAHFSALRGATRKFLSVADGLIRVEDDT